MCIRDRLFALTSMSVYILPHFHTLPAIAAKAIIIPIGGVDVYKRQVLYSCLATANITGGSAWMTKKMIFGLLLTLVGMAFSLFCFIPVSYTHLDVYKRQIFIFSRM